jgi:hypothetical protein
MATAPSTFKNVIEAPPRMTGRPEIDGVSSLQWIWSLFTKGILNGSIVQEQNIPQVINEAGAVIGPATAIDGNVTLFDGITGKLVKDGGTLGTAAFQPTSAFDAAGTAVAVVGVHAAAADPHPVYLTAAEGAAAFDAIGTAAAVGALALQKANNLSDVASPTSSASNIGVGTEDTPQFTGATLTDNLTLPKTSGKGIKIDTAAPTFGWRDILGQIVVKAVGVTDPDWAVYRGSIYQYAFTNGAHLHEAWLSYHIPHDYVPDTDMLIHCHWSQKTVDTGGAAGGAADPFIAPFTVSITQQASTTQYGHLIAEVQFTGASLAANTVRVDGVLLVRIYRDSADAADTLNQDPFVHFVDIHYQSTNVGTKQNNPVTTGSFYT